MTARWMRRAGALALCFLSLAAAAAPGGYDPTFGNNGIQVDRRLRMVEFDSLLVEPDGRMVVSASEEGSPTVLRYNADGSIDTSFDTDGMSSLSLGEWGSAIVRQPDGRIVVATRQYPDGYPRITRLNADGSIDRAFGTNGFTLFEIPGHDTDDIAGVALRPDGRIVVAVIGVQLVASPAGTFRARSIVVAQLLPDGRMDPSFDDDGIVAYPQIESYWTEAMAIDAAGKIVIAGHIMAPACCESFVARLEANGSPDFTFGSAAEVRGPSAVTTGTTGLVLQGDRIVVAAEERRGPDVDSPVDIVLARYGPTGQADASFGANGRTRVRLATRNYVAALRARGDGRLWLMGEAVSSAGDRQILVARFTANGAFDRSWRGKGTSLLPMGEAPALMRAGVVQPDGNLLMGFHNSGIMLARVLAGTASEDDNDTDGVPNGVEPGEGLDPAAKDNDVFARARLFAMQQYRDFLGREGDPGGVNYHAARLQDGSTTRAQLVENFLDSPEFQAGVPQATRLHLSFLGRVPDYDALQFFASLYRAGISLETMVERYLGSSLEFGKRQSGLSNSEYVDFVYREVLWRDADAAGRQYYLDRLNDGRMTRAAMMLAFSECAEFRHGSSDEVFVNSLYAAMLRRAPDQGGWNYYLDRLASGYPRNAVIEDFVRSPEYRGRFLP